MKRFYKLLAGTLQELLDLMNISIPNEYTVIHIGKHNDFWYCVVDKLGIIIDDVEFDANNNENDTVISA